MQDTRNSTTCPDQKKASADEGRAAPQTTIYYDSLAQLIAG